MITEILFFLLAVLTLVYHSWYVNENMEQIKMLTKALMSKNLKEFDESELVGQLPTREEVETEELVDIRDISDKEFNKLIKEQKDFNKLTKDQIKS